ncbi:MAG TPA: S8 family serine peptidase [Vicinamibacterales bacterium]|jgi:thermitase|nr:S8 family serine peptidase [Vicinamibacterales bacterium]
MRLGKVAVCLALALVAFASFASAQPPRRQAVAGQILVTFRPAANANAKADAHRGARGRLVSEIASRGVALVAVPDGDEDAAVARYRRNSNVLFAEPNYIRHVPEPTAHGGDTPLLPRDKYFDQQWGFHNTGQEFYCFAWIFGDLCFYQGTPDADIDAPEAWAVSTGSPTVTVAVIDTGIDYNHPDLAGHYAGGYDFVHSTFDPLDDHGHGTHVAGTIAASLENLTGSPAAAEGVVGVAPQARLLAYKVCAADGTCTDFAVIQAISRAVADGAKVINMSLGDTVYSQSLADAVQQAWNAGVVIVAGAGNDGVTAPFYPAALDHVIAVGAFDEEHNRASFSNYGSWVDIAAPGSNILSTYPLSKCTEAGVPGETGCYAWLSGTSMATPHVAGAAALIWSRGDVTSNTQVVDLLLNNADPSGVSNVRLDSWTIHGGLNLHDALSDGLATGKPVANAGPDQTVIDTDGDGSEIVTLDGSGSHDDNGSIVAYEWRDGATLLGSDAILALPLAVGTHVVTLEVTDNDGLTATDTVPVTVQPASLVTLAVSVPQATEAGITAGVFTVSRTGETSGTLTVQYVVTGTATPGTDYQSLAGTVLFGAGAATATITVTPIDDDLLESNESVVITLSPGVGYGLGSPGSGSIAIVSDDLPPDLVVQSTAAPATGGADADIVVSETTKNLGTGTAANSATGFYLSVNSTFDASDVFLGGRPAPQLAPGAADAASTTLHLPASTAAGSYYVLAKSDWNSQVSESVETNNVKASGAVKIGPDLLVSALTTPAAAVPGTTFSVSDTTVNSGGGRAIASTTRFFLSTNGSLDAADVPLGSRAVPELSPGASHAGTTQLALPASTPGGLYFVIAQADNDKVVGETSEINNNRSSASLKVGGDLSVSVLNMPAIVVVGGTISVSDSTTNQGAGPVSDSSTGFYLSANSVLDVGDQLLGSRAVGPLAAGATSAGVTAVQIPAGIAPGTYYLIAKADRADVVSESVESNNTRTAGIAIGPDLWAMSVRNPATAIAGTGVEVTDAVKNLGADTFPASTTRFYLSTNSSLDASDVLLGSRPVPAVAVGVTDTGSVTVVIPPQTAPGSYFVLAAADGDGVVAEAVESNNTVSRRITISAPPAP